MGISIEAVAAAGKNKGKSKGVGARVTKGVLAQVDVKGVGQACIGLRGDEDLELYRGDINVEIAGTTYRITKTDSHAAWATKQGENVSDFVALFNLLSEDVGKYQGEITIG